MLRNTSASAGNVNAELAVRECSLGEHKINSFNLLQVLRIISLSYISPRLVSANQAPRTAYMMDLLPFKNVDESVFGNVDVSDPTHFLLSFGLLL